jgi:hypothetical protein
MPNSVSVTVSRPCRKLGLPKGASLRVLRHSDASLLLADGVDLTCRDISGLFHAKDSVNAVPSVGRPPVVIR